MIPASPSGAGIGPLVGWPDSRGAYSLRLSRMLMVVACLAMLATDALSLFSGASSATRTSPAWGMPIAALLILPIVGSIAAGVTLSSRSGLSRTRGPRAGGAIEAGALDRVWRAAGSLTLAIYPALLVVGGYGPVDALTPHGELVSKQSLLLSYSMVATVVAAALLSEAVRFVYVVALYPLGVGYAVHTVGEIGYRAMTAPVFLVTFNLMLACAITWMSLGARELDRATAELARRELEMAREQASQIARRRADSYIHDNVLSALTPAITGVADGEYLRCAARRALDSLEATPVGEGSLGVRDLFAMIESEVKARSESVQTTVSVGEEAAAQLLPVEVSDAIMAACMEAVVNSLRHARRTDGSPVSRRIEMSVGARGLRVCIRDDGQVQPGGTPRTGRSHGIRNSIIQRMRDVGGDAQVRFRSGGRGAGSGVSVTLTWSHRRDGADEESALRLNDPVVARAAQSRSAWVLGGWAVIAHLIILLGELPNYTAIAGPTTALAWQAAAAYLLLRRYPGAIPPPWVRWFAYTAVGLGNLLALFPIVTGGYPEYAAWSLGSGWMLCVALLVRYGPEAAWGALGFLGATTWLWTAIAGHPGALALTMMAGQVVSLAFYTLVVQWYGATMRSLARTERAARDLESLRLAAQESRLLLDERLHSVEQRSRPLLQDLADGGRLSPERMRAASALEARLRDEIRAPALCTQPLVAAANRARGRGVEVVLLDDRSGPPPPATVMLEVEEVAVRTLERASGGRVVVRLLPAGREQVATVVGPDGARSVPCSASYLSSHSEPGL